MNDVPRCDATANLGHKPHVIRPRQCVLPQGHEGHHRFFGPVPIETEKPK
jgi:hypothetical protein